LLWNEHTAIIIHHQSDYITITQCTLTSSFRFAIYIEEKSKATVYKNNFKNNTLHAVYCKDAKCIGRHNYWGSITGPTFFEKQRKERITPIKIQYIPWLLSPIENTGANWKIQPQNISIPQKRYKQIQLNGNDTDKDGLPDWWELKWGYETNKWNDHENLDPDNDALNNFEECYTDSYGSNPYIKDIFLEIDWVKRPKSWLPTNKPSQEIIDEITQIFEWHGIQLHIDVGDCDGGEEVPYVTNFSYADLRDFYWDYFLHNDLNNPRKGIFHYCFTCDFGPGRGFAFIGWDHIDSFDISAQMLQDSFPQYSRSRVIMAGAIHELGHTLGLFVDDHGGIDNEGATKLFSKQWLKYRNYRSCMNYYHTYKILGYSDGNNGPGDFNDWSNLDYMFFKNSHLEWPKT